MKRLLAKVPKGRPKKGAPEGQLSKDQCTRLADLPDWLPSPVREFVLWAEEAWQRDENALAVLRRIATTPKMEVVWDTLKKRRASDSALRDFVRCACKYALLHGHKIFPMISRQERDASAKQFSDAVGLSSHEFLPAAPSSQRPPRSWRTISKHVHNSREAYSRRWWSKTTSKMTRSAPTSKSLARKRKNCSATCCGAQWQRSRRSPWIGQSASGKSAIGAASRTSPPSASFAAGSSNLRARLRSALISGHLRTEVTP